MMLDGNDDIHADILAAIEGQSAPAPVPTVGDVQTTTPETQSEPTTSDQLAQAARDEQGRFAPKEKVAPTQEKVQLDPATPVLAQEPPSETIPPPHSLKAAVKAAWETYPIEIRQELVRIEQEAQKGKTEWQSKGERLNRIDGLLEPVRDRLTLNGIDDAAYIQALIRADEMLRGPQKEQALAQLAGMYGVNLASGQQVQAQPQQQQFQPPADPYIQALMQQVQGLQQHLSQQQLREHQQEEQRQAGEQTAILSEVEAFRKDNLYFDNVKTEMAQLLRSGLAPDLKDAYEKACKLHPEVSQLIATASVAPKPPAQGRPALSVVGSPGAPVLPASPQSPHSDIEDDVRNAILEVQRRV